MQNTCCLFHENRLFSSTANILIKHTCKPTKGPNKHSSLSNYKTMLIFIETVLTFYSLQKACQAILETEENPNVCSNTNMDL